jgi:ferrous iron transport protein A
VIKSLAEIGPGGKGKITEVRGDRALCRRILDMGIVPDAEVEVERVAPLGDPVEIRVKGYHVSLRKEEAANIHVEVMAMPLTTVSPGAEVTLVAVNAGRGLVRRLSDIGLYPGVSLKVIHSGRPGPFVIQVGDSRLALGHGVAQKILVKVK